MLNEDDESHPFYYGGNMKKYIIPIFIPHYGCIHDCVFCNQNKITGKNAEITKKYVEEIISFHMKNIKFPRDIEIAYYGGSFTALNIQKQIELLSPAYDLYKKNIIKSVRVSTRPDCISTEILENLISLGVKTIELGVQSLDDDVLYESNRGHTSEAVYEAVNLVKTTPLSLVLQIMPGLPNDNLLTVIKTAIKIIQLQPDFVRIYPTVVIEGTKLANLYREKIYKPLNIGQAVGICAFLKVLFEESHIKVIRTGLQATEELDDEKVVLDGPYHPSFGEMVDSFVFKIMVNKILDNVVLIGRNIKIYYNSKDASKIRGMNKSNIVFWKTKYNISNIKMEEMAIEKGFCIIEIDNIKYFINRKFIDL